MVALPGKSLIYKIIYTILILLIIPPCTAENTNKQKSVAFFKTFFQTRKDLIFCCELDRPKFVCRAAKRV